MPDRKLLRAGLFAACLLAMAPTLHADDKAYDIKFLRPVKAGDKFAIASRVVDSQVLKVEVSGVEMRNETLNATYAIDGTMVVTAVDDKGRETGFHVVINKLQLTEGDAPTADAAPPGTEFDVLYKNKIPEITTREVELSPAAKQALSGLFTTRSDRTEDELQGTPEKKKIGDTWPVNEKTLADEMADSGIKVDPEKTKGQVKLKALGTLAGIPALNLEENVDINYLSSPLGKAKEAHMTALVTSQLPVDVANPSIATEMTMKTHAVLEQKKEDATILITLDANTKKTESRILVK